MQRRDLFKSLMALPFMGSVAASAPKHVLGRGWLSGIAYPRPMAYTSKPERWAMKMTHGPERGTLPGMDLTGTRFGYTAPTADQIATDLREMLRQDFDEPPVTDELEDYMGHDFVG